MSYLGSSRIDNTKRLTIRKEIADILDVKSGDHLFFFLENGEIIIRKGSECLKNELKNRCKPTDGVNDSRRSAFFYAERPNDKVPNAR